MREELCSEREMWTAYEGKPGIGIELRPTIFDANWLLLATFADIAKVILYRFFVLRGVRQDHDL